VIFINKIKMKDIILSEEQLEKLVSNTGAVYMKGSNLSQNL
jgi:hypothetical protein